MQKLQPNLAAKALLIILFLLASLAPDFTLATPTNVGLQDASSGFSSTNYKVSNGINNIEVEKRERRRRIRAAPPPPKAGKEVSPVAPPPILRPPPPPPPSTGCTPGVPPPPPISYPPRHL
ncbi:hypothetical protein SOVF_040040 [Spinacia oleracea]|nr:hypothetical protein SOVF_040040 [Spinacia oleracea]